MASRSLMTESFHPTQENTEQALRVLLLAIAGPNYAGALKQGDVGQQIDRCLSWVKAEASEAASLIFSPTAMAQTVTSLPSPLGRTTVPRTI